MFKVFNKGWKDVPCFSPLPTSSIAPWISLSSSEKLTLGSSVIGKIESISLELSVLLTQPQPSWHLLLKVLLFTFLNKKNVGFGIMMYNDHRLLLNRLCKLNIKSLQKYLKRE